MLIQRPPSATLTTINRHIPLQAHTRFKAEMVPALWDAALKYGIDPVGLIAQAGKETGWGNYGTQAHPSQHNTCGLKWHDEFRNAYAPTTAGNAPLAHATFGSFRVGAEAHAQHLYAYMGIELPKWQINVDPRYQLVLDIYGKVNPSVHWSDLSGKWAPNVSYGQGIEELIDMLITG